jgi:hypothetical protein
MTIKLNALLDVSLVTIAILSAKVLPETEKFLFSEISNGEIVYTPMKNLIRTEEAIGIRERE